MLEIIALIIALPSLLVAYIVYYNNSIGDVVVYAQIDKRRQTIINIVIHNIGKGVARDIKFISPQGIPKAAFGITGLKDPITYYESGAFSNGIPILLPDEKLIYTWGQYGGIKEALKGHPLQLEITFYSPTWLQIKRRKITNKITVDPSIFEGVDISESSFEREVKAALKDIAKAIKELSK